MDFSLAVNEPPAAYIRWPRSLPEGIVAGRLARSESLNPQDASLDPLAFTSIFDIAGRNRNNWFGGQSNQALRVGSISTSNKFAQSTLRISSCAARPVR
jgi:hypothetical protein